MNELLLRRRELLAANAVSSNLIIIPPDGIYILGIDNRFYKETEWTQPNEEAVGVAVIADKAKFIIPPEDTRPFLVWDTNPNPVTVKGVMVTSNFNKGKKDFKGESNTDKIVSQLGEGNSPAAEYCKKYSLKNGRKGYLGSLGEWQLVYSQKDKVMSALNIIGSKGLMNSTFLSSTQCSDKDAWSLGFSGSQAMYQLARKNTGGQVLPFCSLD